jgi:hypothetical protein
MDICDKIEKLFNNFSGNIEVGKKAAGYISEGYLNITDNGAYWGVTYSGSPIDPKSPQSGISVRADFSKASGQRQNTPPLSTGAWVTTSYMGTMPVREHAADNLFKDVKEAVEKAYDFNLHNKP